MRCGLYGMFRLENWHRGYLASLLEASQRRLKMSEWISVEDRLPEHCEKVIVCHGKNKTVEIGMWHRGHKWTDKPWGLYLDVTHWQPIPDPPE